LSLPSSREHQSLHLIASPPPGSTLFPYTTLFRSTLAREVREATAELGIPEANLTVHDFEVRTFPDRRQDILELLIALWEDWRPEDRKSTRLNSSHQIISYAVFCLKKKKTQTHDDK